MVYDVIARDRASRTFTRVGQSMHGLSRTSRGVGAAVKAGLAIGGVAAGGLAYATLKAAGDFEKAMNRVRAVTGASGKDFKALREQAKHLGATTQYSATQAADAMGFLAMAGFSTTQIMKAMPGTLNLAAAGQMNLARAADISSNILTGYGFKAEKTGKVVDVLAKTFTSTNTNLQQLGDAFKYAGPVAHSAGVKFEEASAAIGLMGNAGIQASMAGTALRGAISRLLAPTKKVQGVLDDLGITVKDAHGNLLPLNQIIKQLHDSGATTGQMMTIFGQRAGPAMASLVDQGAGALVKLTKKLENSGGTADHIAKVQMEGLKGQMVALKSAWEGFLIELGDLGVLKVATGAVEGLTTATRGLSELVNEHGLPAIDAFSDRMSEMLPVKDIKHTFGTAKKLVGDFFGALAGPRKAPMPKGGKGHAYDPAPTVAGMKPSAAKRVGGQIRDAVAGGLSKLDWGKLGSSLGAGIGKAITWLSGHIGEISNKLLGALSKLDWTDIGKKVGSQSFGFLIGFLASFGSEIVNPTFWKKHFWDLIVGLLSITGVGKVAGVLGKIFTKIPVLRAIAPFLKKIDKVTAPISKAVGKVIKFFGSSLWKGIARVFPRAAAVLEREAGLLTTRLGVWGLDLLKAGGKAVRGLGSGIKRGTGWVISKIGELIGWLLKPFAKAGSWLVKRGGRVVAGLARGIANRAKGMGSWVWVRVGKPVVDAFKRAGSWLYGKGKAFVSGFKRGALAIGKSIGSWIWRHTGRPAVNVFAKAGSWLYSKGKAFVGGLKRGVLKTASGIKGWMGSHVVSPIRSRFSAAGSWLYGKGKSLVSGLKNGIISAVKGIGRWLKSHLIDPIVRAVKRFFGIHSPSRVFAGIGGNLVAGLMKGLARTSGKAIAKKIFGDMPSALGALVKKGLVSVQNLPGKALKALGGLGGQFLDLIGFSGGGNSNANQRLGRAMAAAYGWTGYQWSALRALWQGESGWNHRALNRSSGAYGIPQCVDLNTQILTRRGWLTHDQVRVGDETIGYNQSTGKSEWTRVTDIHHGVGELRRFGTSLWSAVSTPNHRWLVERTVPLCDLPPEPGSIPYGQCQCGCGGTTAPARNPVPEKGIKRGEPNLYLHGHHARGKRRNPDSTHEYFVEQQALQRGQQIVLARPAATASSLGITIQEAALLAWIAGDGWQQKPRPVRGKNVEKGYKSGSTSMTYFIGQTKEENWEAIDAAVGDHGRITRTRERHVKGELRRDREWRLSAPYARDLTERAGNPKTDCVQQVLGMSTAQREAWLEAIIAAEGNVSAPRGKAKPVTQITQKAGPLAEAIVLAVYLSGRRPSVYVSKRTGERHGTVPVWTITLTSPRTGEPRTSVNGKECWKDESIGVQDVWCVTTDLGSWTARQGDDVFLTGNSLPASKMASAGKDWRTNPATQIKWGMRYIKSRYGSPAAALAAWQHRSPHWYGHGGTFQAGQMIGVGDRGRELLMFDQPGRVLSPEATRGLEMLARQGARGGDTYQSTYHLYQRDMTLRDLELLQRRQEARARVGRPR
ncbi:phage tail tape measure protein [Streptomyces sp. 891-h]|uniref:phage tail tape measure protein n=1 Tax=Streptomyces sp. 891-h TaxID=2720714 RepID=UPI001FA9F1B5|nr:phage tail tape measure protein [Streptomyces sp. 891-h]UNZ20630.1 phage tail tape measure protein [Streptomyces sp. 891-h]